jgi:molybdate transport system substrate-binding protein
MRKIKLPSLLSWGIAALFLCSGNILLAAELHVFAAASLTDALKELQPVYEKKTGDTLLLNLAASSLLARQIQEGAPADLFLSADEEKMDQLEKKKLLMEGSHKSLLSNQLVIVVPSDRPRTFSSLRDLAGADVKKIALAETQSVPAGIYAKACLQKAGLWDQLAGRVIPVENVRAALAAAEAGNVDAAIVYKTDALISKRVKVAYEVSLAEGPRISYPIAGVKTSLHPKEAKSLLAFLESSEALSVFKKYGFLVPQ